jgi:hypothetical protein
MLFGSQEKQKSPTSRVLKKIADSENNINQLSPSPIDLKEKADLEIGDSINLNSNSLNPSIDSEQ